MYSITVQVTPDTDTWKNCKVSGKLEALNSERSSFLFPFSSFPASAQTLNRLITLPSHFVPFCVRDSTEWMSMNPLNSLCVKASYWWVSKLITLPYQETHNSIWTHEQRRAGGPRAKRFNIRRNLVPHRLQTTNPDFISIEEPVQATIT